MILGMNVKQIKYITYALVFLSASFVYSQGLLPKLGEQRAGTASMTFLKIGVGARAVSMSGAYVAMADDGSAMYWNPAGIVQIGKNELVMSHMDWLADIKYEFLGYAHQLNSNIGIGMYVGYLHLADMPVTTEYHPFGNGEYFGYNDMVTGLSGSLKMTDKFSFGITLKYVRETLDDLVMDGFMVDFGTYYWTGFKSLRVAAAMRNFGPEMKPGGTYMQTETSGSVSETDYQGFSPPIVFSLGTAMDVYEYAENVFTLSIQMDHPMDDQEIYVAGLEYDFNNILQLRSGYKANFEENHWSFGGGLSVPMWGNALQIDYSYAEFTNLSMTQQFTIGFKF